MRQRLDFKITAPSLLRFSLPTVVMMVLTDFYVIIDGIFISRYIGIQALSSLNIVLPFMLLAMSVGIMLSSGGSAVVAKEMGEGQEVRAKSDFTMFALSGAVLGSVLCVAGYMFSGLIVRLLGGTGVLQEECTDYLLTMLPFLPALMLHILFQMFFVVAGRPQLGLLVTVTGGITNILLDYLFIALLGLGMKGAAMATGIGYLVPACCGIYYFGIKRENLLSFTRPSFRLSTLGKALANGMSEMIQNLACSVSTFLFNLQMMKLAGVEGVAAITIILYVDAFLIAIFTGFSMGVSPLISFYHGKGDCHALKRIRRISFLALFAYSILMYGATLATSPSIVSVFVERGTETYLLATGGFPLFALSYFCMGFNIFTTAMFTALNNGKVSALISVLDTFLCLGGSLYFLPLFLGLTGVWTAIPMAELLTFCISGYFIWKYRKIYRY